MHKDILVLKKLFIKLVNSKKKIWLFSSSTSYSFSFLYSTFSFLIIFHCKLLIFPNGVFLSCLEYTHRVSLFQGPGGVTVKKTSQALIIGIYDEPMTPGQCNVIVERLGDYLIDQGLWVSLVCLIYVNPQGFLYKLCACWPTSWIWLQWHVFQVLKSYGGLICNQKIWCLKKSSVMVFLVVLLQWLVFWWF